MVSGLVGESGYQNLFPGPAAKVAWQQASQSKSCFTQLALTLTLYMFDMPVRPAFKRLLLNAVCRKHPAPAASRANQAKRLKIKVPLVPPKPKLFFMAASIFTSRAVLAQ